MDEFQTINDIITTTIKDTSYVSALISSCVFIIYTLIIRIVDYLKSKNKNKELIELNKSIKSFGETLVKQNNVLDKFLSNTIKKEQIRTKTAIELAFVNFQSKLEHQVRDIILHNNIKSNEEFIKTNVPQIVNTEYYRLYSNLNSYEINDVPVSYFLKTSMIDETSSSILAIIYNGQSSQDRVSQINNKLTAISNNYSTYVYNKTFNN